MSENGIKPIDESFLKKNFLFGLEFSKGFVYGRVIRTRLCNYRPWALIDSDGDAVDIAVTSHKGELLFRDPRNTANDILFLPTSTNGGYPWIMHGGIGIKPAQINMYPRFPSGKEIPGKFPNIDPIRPGSGDNVGYVDYTTSPYEEPTDYVEYVIPPSQTLGAEYYNIDDEKAHQPVLNLLFSVYWFQVLHPGLDDRLISAIASRAVPASFLTVGFGDVPIELGGVLEEDWHIDPMTLAEAARLGGR